MLDRIQQLAPSNAGALDIAMRLAMVTGEAKQAIELGEKRCRALEVNADRVLWQPGSCMLSLLFSRSAGRLKMESECCVE